MIFPTETMIPTDSQWGISDMDADAVNRAAAGLLSQQIWCWGQDIKRAEGNWLLELGFTRTPPPEDQKNCASVYTLSLSQSKRIVLRGFGVFFGDDTKGGVFLERYVFRPQFTEQSRLTVGPWACEDLPAMADPTAEQSIRCRLMMMELIEWIIGYEVNMLTRLGIDYRRESLERWNNGKRWYLPAERMTCRWRRVSLAVAANNLQLWDTKVSDCE